MIVTNGEELDDSSKQVVKFLKEEGRLQAHIHSDEPLSPPVARQRGVEKADGKYLFFFDNHCLVGRQYFDRALLDFEKYDMGMLHSTTRFYTGSMFCYHYKLKLEYNFWGDTGCSLPTYEHKPYQCAMGGHGGIVVPHDVWDKVGGYGPEHLLEGYGGEEPIFDLKLWRMGYTVWIDPRLVHYHYTGTRGYSRHYTDEYYTNILVAANVIGGEKWMHKLLDSFLTKSHIRPMKPGMKNWYEMLEIANDRSKDYTKELDSKAIRSLDECLEYFRFNEVAH